MSLTPSIELMRIHRQGSLNRGRVMADKSPWTPEQEAAITEINGKLAAIANICQLMFGSFARTVEESRQRLAALGQTLLAKQYLTESEWLAALQEVELGDRAEFALNEEVQAALEDVRKIVRDAGEEPA